MKLRNKKTREILEIKLIQTNCECLTEHEIDTYYGEPITLKLLNRMCEDYTPQEPLIKDEDVRKIVLSWYNANFPTKDYEIYYTAEDYRLSCHLICIDFQCNRGLENLDEDRTYTITELCGEEE